MLIVLFHHVTGEQCGPNSQPIDILSDPRRHQFEQRLVGGEFDWLAGRVSERRTDPSSSSVGRTWELRLAVPHLAQKASVPRPAISDIINFFIRCGYFGYRFAGSR